MSMNFGPVVLTNSGPPPVCDRLPRAAARGSRSASLFRPPRQALAALRAASPSSVLWSFEALRRGAGRTLEQCLQDELALTRHATRHPDFLEGVRAMVVDKDRTPRWSPPRMEDVDTAGIIALFA